MVRITVDNREDGKVIKGIKTAFGDVVAESVLEVGDVQIDGDKLSFLVERKTASDFVASIMDKRLFRQVLDMVAVRSEKVIPIFVMVGNREMGKIIKIRKMSYKHILGTELWIAEQGLGLVKCWSDHDYYYLLKKLVDRAEEGGKADILMALRVFRSTMRCNTDEDMAIGMLCGIRGIGVKTAKKILTKNNIRELVDMLYRNEPIEGMNARVYETVKRVIEWKGCPDENF